MIYSSLDSSRQDESNDSKIIPIGAIFAEIAIFAKFQVGSGWVNCLTRPEFSGRVGYPNLGSKMWSSTKSHPKSHSKSHLNPVVVEGQKYHYSNRLVETSRMVVFPFFHDHWMSRYSTKCQTAQYRK